MVYHYDYSCSEFNCNCITIKESYKWKKDKWSIQFVQNESEGGTERHELRELADDTSGQKYINAFNDKIAFSTYILIFLG